ncbi:hypothetical protein NPS74_15530, partial [Cutibacterium acnes subsp. acnes]|nr:hypothetical protein [Cutibacterium acnes subsp. acnes]
AGGAGRGGRPESRVRVLAGRRGLGRGGSGGQPEGGGAASSDQREGAAGLGVAVDLQWCREQTFPCGPCRRGQYHCSGQPDQLSEEGLDRRGLAIRYGWDRRAPRR